ncbi:MAG: hypothetical protein V1870_03805 [Candidatus Aenigmatarchaeota archaeon]
MKLTRRDFLKALGFFAVFRSMDAFSVVREDKISIPEDWQNYFDRILENKELVNDLRLGNVDKIYWAFDETVIKTFCEQAMERYGDTKALCDYYERASDIFTKNPDHDIAYLFSVPIEEKKTTLFVFPRGIDTYKQEDIKLLLLLGGAHGFFNIFLNDHVSVPGDKKLRDYSLDFLSGFVKIASYGNCLLYAEKNQDISSQVRENSLEKYKRYYYDVLSRAYEIAKTDGYTNSCKAMAEIMIDAEKALMNRQDVLYTFGLSNGDNYNVPFMSSVLHGKREPVQTYERKIELPMLVNNRYENPSLAI